MDLNQLKRDIEARMTKSIDTLASQLLRLRTGRANPALLDHVRVDYYGSDVPISQVANVVVEDARTLSITPWERTMIAAIFIIMFVVGWNQYLWPTLITTNEVYFTLVRGIKQIIQVWVGSQIPEYSQAMALAILAMLSGICTWYKPGGRLSKDAVREIFLGMVLALARGEVPAEAVAASPPPARPSTP